MSLRDAIARIDGKPGAVAAITLAIGFVVMAAYTTVLTPPPLMQPDSPAYLTMSLLRAPGYPVLLAVLRQFDPAYSTLPYLQMAVFVIATAFMAETFHRLRPAALLWSSAGAAVFVNPFLWRYAWTITTESLFISAAMIFLGCFANALRRRPGGHGWLVAASLALAVAALIRPVAYALIAVGFLATLLWWRPRWKAMAALLAPVLACIVMVSALNGVTRGAFALQVFSGYTLVGDVAFLIRPEPASPHNDVAAPIAAKLKPVSERLPPPGSKWAEYFWLTSEGTGSAAYGTIMPLLRAAAAKDAAGAGEDQMIVRVDRLAMAVARDAILRDPVAYAWHVAVNFAALWTLPVILSAHEAQEIVRLLCDPRLEGFYCRDGKATAVMIVVPKSIAAAKTLLFAGLFVLTLIVAFAAAFRGAQSPLLAMLGVTALCIDGHHGLVALVNTALPRYAMAMWPFLCVFTAGTLLLVLSWAAAMRRRKG